MALDSGIPDRNDESKLLIQKSLDHTLTDLEDRGLIGWDRHSNRYDLHPIVRSVVWAALSSSAQKDIYYHLHGYFDAAPKQLEWEKIECIDDLSTAIELYHSLIGLESYDEAFDVFRLHLDRASHWKLSISRQRVEWLQRLFPDGLNEMPRLVGLIKWGYTLNSLALAFQNSGEPKCASQLFRRSIEICELIHDDLNEVVGIGNLSNGNRSLTPVKTGC